MLQRIGPMEIILILVIALLIFGPSKLPQLGRSVGDTIREFRKSMQSTAKDDAEEDKPSAQTEEKKA